jgi:ubiquinone/menaquinone biosynthesis C-methylase UbiE
VDTPDFHAMYRSRWPEASRDLAYRWHPRNAIAIAYRHQRERAVVAALDQLPSLDQLEILDVGCGTGANLRFLVECGAAASRVHGIDVIAERVAVSQEKNPSIDVRVAGATNLPFEDASVDLATQFVAFSSMPEGRRTAADEITRVVRPGGALLWYDVVRPAPGRIPDGIPVDAVQRLFPQFDLVMTRMVHSRLTSRLARRTLLLEVSERMPFPARTNVMALLQRSG